MLIAVAIAGLIVGYALGAVHMSVLAKKAERDRLYAKPKAPAPQMAPQEQ